MVIDPARKFLTGDEEDSNAASEFFEALEEFAISKGTAVLVVHHLQKGAVPKSAHETMDMLRVRRYLSIARASLSACSVTGLTPSSACQKQYPPSLGMVTEERVFARDPKQLGLVWLPGHKGVREAELAPEELKKLAEEAKKKAAPRILNNSAQ